VPVTIAPEEVHEQIAQAFARADAWAALPPPAGDRVVSLRDGGQGTGIPVHPLGALSARQRVLPFGPTIDRYGTSVVEPVSFSLAGFRVAGSATTAAAEDLHDDFAPGQFMSLTDDEKLARPAFESLRSGGRVPVSSFRLPADRPAGVAVQADYEEAIVDTEPATGERQSRRPSGNAAALPSALIAMLAGNGASGRAETRQAGAAQFAGRRLDVAIKPERYIVAGADTLAPVAGSAPESAAEAHDRMGRRGARAAPAQVVPAREAA
jgi:hypothetical protein